MTVFHKQLTLVSDGGFDVLNVTEPVRAAVREAGITAGQVLVFYKHTTGAVVLAEHEAGLLSDLQVLLEQITPRGADYRHHLRGYDINGAAHLRSILLGVSVTVPVIDGDLDLGTYQEILVLDFDVGAKTRSLTVQVLGE